MAKKGIRVSDDVCAYCGVHYHESGRMMPYQFVSGRQKVYLCDACGSKTFGAEQNKNLAKKKK